MKSRSIEVCTIKKDEWPLTSCLVRGHQIILCSGIYFLTCKKKQSLIVTTSHRLIMHQVVIIKQY